MSESPIQTISLTGKTTIVTGASSGIGRAIASRFGAAGAHVTLVGRAVASMEVVKKEIEQKGGQATISTADVRDPAQVQELVDGAVAETGRLDIMVNNAGIFYAGPIADGSPDEWRAMLETNILGLLVGSQAAIKAMRACSAEGHIVNISSIAADRRDTGVYGATKHAVNAISATLRTELEEDDIRVVNVMPGPIATNFGRNMDPAVVQGVLKVAGRDLEWKPGERLPDDVFDDLGALERLMGRPESVAEAVLYAVGQPQTVNIADIVVRPPKQLHIPH